MFENYHFHDFIGNLGVSMIIITYLLLQLRKISATTISYSAINACGSLLVIVSLGHEFNLSAVLMESFWAGISIFGLIMTLRRRRRGLNT